jgi:hypothetical protein
MHDGELQREQRVDEKPMGRAPADGGIAAVEIPKQSPHGHHKADLRDQAKGDSQRSAQAGPHEPLLRIHAKTLSG